MAEDGRLFDENDIAELRLMLRPFKSSCGCMDTAASQDDDWLAGLLMRYGDVASAAYAGCLMLAENSECRLSDGTTLPNNRQYWLGLARLYRLSGGRCIQRADEVFDSAEIGGVAHE